MAKCWMLILLAFLVACTPAPTPMPEAGVDGRVEAWFWDTPDTAPTKLAAAGIRGLGGDRFVLQAPLIRRPLSDGGFLTLVAPAGQVSAARSAAPQIRIEPPVTVAGVMAGKPLAGLAETVQLDPQAGTWLLLRLDAAWGAQRITAARLDCDAQGRWRAQDLRVSPAGAGVAASLGAVWAEGLQ